MASEVARAVGLVPHTGWTWLVRVRGSLDGARVESRSRVVACDVLDGELYHLAADYKGDRQKFVAERRAAAVERARKAIRPEVDDARSAVVLGKRMTLPPVERIVMAHPLIHGAEGELWRAIFAEACAAQGISVARSEAGHIEESLVKRYSRSAIDAFLAEGKRIVGPPWGREPREAALGAWSSLPHA